MQLHQNLISGQFVDGAGVRENQNPSDLSEVVGLFAQADEAQTSAAIDAALDAFPTWSRTTISARAEILDRAGTEVLARRDELGRLLAREEGKTLADGVGEVVRAGQVLRFFAGEAVRLTGESIPSLRPGVSVEITREPIGVVGIITPWNFPAAIPAWKIAPALAYGNCVVFKPADLVPGSAWALVDILHRAGVPAGVLNLVMGRGSVVGEALLTSPGIAGVSFTGSVETGHRVAVACASRGAKVQLEMGGKNPLVVLDDADLRTAVDCALQGAFFQTGQRCTASSRLVVQAGIHDAFVEALSEKVRGLRVDNALAPGVDLGPVVDQSQLDQDLAYIKIAQDEGGQLVCGGGRLERATDGFYVEPALFVGTTNDQRINREEVFGPVASVIRVGDFDEAVAVANDTAFGLSSGICTTSLRHAAEYKRRAEAGMVMVNLPTAGVDYHVPFGGRKGSSYGSREQGRYAAEFYTTVKTSYVAP